MASFQANIGWERLRKRENKKNRPDGFLTDPENEIQKKQQKNSKNQKTPSQLFLKPKQVAEGRETEKTKQIVLMDSYPTRNRKFQKNSIKILKIRKHHHSFFSSQNRQGKAKKERENQKKKSFQWVPTQPGIENSKNIAKKFENTIISSFQDKISWKMPRKRENKKNRSDKFLPDPEQKIPKTQEKHSKI